jgi:hypothetical protein
VVVGLGLTSTLPLGGYLAYWWVGGDPGIGRVHVLVLQLFTGGHAKAIPSHERVRGSERERERALCLEQDAMVLN